jgi:hypothetical protein
MQRVRRRQVQCGRRCRLQELPGGFELAFAERSSEQLQVQRGLVGGGWRRMHGVRRRQVQGFGRRCELQQVSGRLGLACAEHSLQVQRWLLRARWKHVRGVRSRQVQRVYWIGRLHGLRDREVFQSSRGHIKFDLHGLWPGHVWGRDRRVH